MAPQLEPVAVAAETDEPVFEPEIELFDEDAEAIEAEVIELEEAAI
ncbi:MAG: hypothetical protein QF476_02110 [Dehalococcoidia bacterium]|jgi:hypothetical protein|nr:hypothetical protein [Dehalococcoidia bacterium]|tara:strand:+ start:4206 stop:4343 length:138 start_codon:yes stop_codon:yes gene_type:complete